MVIGNWNVTERPLPAFVTFQSPITGFPNDSQPRVTALRYLSYGFASLQHADETEGTV